MSNQRSEQEYLQAEATGTPEKRITGSDRRKNKDRRSVEERRLDYRLAPNTTTHLIAKWFRTIIRPRLGVDRRKGRDRRRNDDRRHKYLTSILSKEELSDLLS